MAERGGPRWGWCASPSRQQAVSGELAEPSGTAVQTERGRRCKCSHPQPFPGEQTETNRARDPRGRGRGDESNVQTHSTRWHACRGPCAWEAALQSRAPFILSARKAEAWPQEGNRAGLRAEPQPGPVPGTVWVGEDDTGTCLDKAPRALGDRRRVHGWPLRVTPRATVGVIFQGPALALLCPVSLCHHRLPLSTWAADPELGAEPAAWPGSHLPLSPPSLHSPHGGGDSTLAQDTLSQASPVRGSSS